MQNRSKAELNKKYDEIIKSVGDGAWHSNYRILVSINDIQMQQSNIKVDYKTNKKVT